MQTGSDLDIARQLAEDCARHIVWLIDSAVARDGVLALTGWALLTEGTPEQARFLVNGVPFDVVRYGLDSPDVGHHYHGVANADRCRYECYVQLADIPPAPYLRFEFEQAGNAALARRTAWWLRTQRGDAAAPDGERISRVIGTSDNFSFEVGGATLFHRIQDLLQSRFGRRYEDMHAILDWGCGAGRLLAHFDGVHGPEIWGSDVDHDNLAHCREHYPFARCVVFPLLPPTAIADATFDLVIGISVVTHLSEPHQAQWLAELRRIVRPGGLVLLSVQGWAQTAMYRESPKLIRKLAASGFVIKGVNPRINDIIGDPSYYIDVVQTREHIREHWGREFEVIEFLDALAANQDLVVMRARG